MKKNEKKWKIKLFNKYITKIRVLFFQKVKWNLLSCNDMRLGESSFKSFKRFVIDLKLLVPYNWIKSYSWIIVWDWEKGKAANELSKLSTRIFLRRCF